MTQQIIESVKVQVNIDRAEVSRKVERAVELNRQIKEDDQGGRQGAGDAQGIQTNVRGIGSVPN
jgi:hypothetical protein